VRQLGRLEALDPREVCRHEAHESTPWLLANADALADVLGLDLELSAAEHPVGGFALDLVGRDLTNSCVLIVENQLAGTDHSHAPGNASRTPRTVVPCRRASTCSWRPLRSARASRSAGCVA
jgi:hypothetical protein